MKENDVATKISSNLLWRFLERFGAQMVTLIVSVVLARVLDPVIYGTVALVIIFTTILQVFVDSGLGNALIQKKDADNLDFSTVFFFNIIICIFLYIFLFFTAPFIGDFYENNDLPTIIRVLGVLLIISGFKNIQNAYVSRHLLFKKYFFATLVGTVAAAIVGIWMAYNGYGVWALIFQNLINQFVDTVILWITVKWRPELRFSRKRLRVLFSYGWKLLVSALLDTIWTELRQLIIGKKYTSDDLAYYNKGIEYPKAATTSLNSSIDSVLFPVMSSVQDDREKVKNMTRRSIKVSSFCLWPMMIGLAVCAKPLVSFLLTDKWLPCCLYLQIFCIVYAFQPIHTANLNAIKAMGRSDYFLILEIIKKVVNLILILSSMMFGVVWLAISSLIGSIVSQIINSWPNRRLLNYSYGQQLLDLLPSLLLAIFMGACAYIVSFFGFSNIVTLIIQVLTGVCIYLAGAWIFKLEPFAYCLDILKRFLNKRNTKIEF